MVQLKKIIIVLFLVAQSISLVYGQQEYRLINKGNKDIQNEKYTEAETNYLKALALPEQQDKANYNLGNAIFKQARFEDAQERYEVAANDLTEADQRAAAYHNLGNSFLEREEFEKSIAQYKNALKQNPNDMDTKYNLAYAQKMLKKEQQEQEQDQEKNEEPEEEEKEGEEKEDENKEEGDSEEDQDKEGENSEEEEDSEEEGQGEEEEDSEEEGSGEEEEKSEEEGEEEAPSQPQQVELTKGEAEQLLKALAGEEAKLQEKMEEEAMTPVDIIIEKDW